MNIIVAPDSFKGNMRSQAVCQIIQTALLKENPAFDVQTYPMADGGEGTVDAVIAATGGKIKYLTVTGPLGTPVNAPYGMLPDGTAIIEMAAASGIELINPIDLNPMKATTFGTGQLMRHLIESGHRHIVIGIGGSATVDGGTGMAQALGFRFIDQQGSYIETHGGKILSKISNIDRSMMLNELSETSIQIACDVTNPLTGPNGAAAIFGPQKGATPDMIPQLDNGLANLRDIMGLPENSGDGAAGGLGYGFRAFCNASIVPGAQLIADTIGLPQALESADLLITGEGRTDNQTASGKLCSVLAGIAREYDTKTLLLSGALKGKTEGFLSLFDYAFSISSGHNTLEENIAHAASDLNLTVRSIARLLRDKL